MTTKRPDINEVNMIKPERVIFIIMLSGLFVGIAIWIITSLIRFIRLNF